MMYHTLVQFMINHVDQLLNNYVQSGYARLVQMLQTPLSIAIGLYFAGLGVAVTQGWLDMSIGQCVKSVSKVAVVFAFAMHWSYFNTYVVQGIEVAANQIAAAIISMGGQGHFAPGQSLYQALQQLLTRFATIGLDAWSAGSWRMISSFFTAIFIWGAGLSLVGAALFQLILAKVMTTLLLILAPLFIGMAIFGYTQVFFNRWVDALMQYIFLTVLVSTVLGLIVTLCNEVVEATHFMPGQVQTLNFIPIVFLAFVGVGLIQRMAGVAMALGSGFSGGVAGMASGFSGALEALSSSGAKGESAPKSTEPLQVASKSVQQIQSQGGQHAATNKAG